MKFLYLLLFLLPCAAAAQVTHLGDVISEGSPAQLETYPVTLKKTPGTRIDVSLSLAGDSLLLTLTGSGTGTATIDKGDKAILNLENNQALIITSIAVQGLEVRGIINTYKHAYQLSPEDLVALSRYRLQQVKKFYMGEYDEVELNDKNAEELRYTCALFLQELDKRQLLRPGRKAGAPAFPGGREVFLQFLNRNVRLQQLPRANEHITASVQFRVGSDGSINDIAVPEAASPELKAELLRVLKRMPKWKPAFQKGRGVEFLVTQKLTFYRQDSTFNVQLDSK